MSVARPSTRKKPHMSVTVVNNGPEAMAGSTLNRFKTKGIIPPIETATIVFKPSATPTTRPRIGFPFQAQATKLIKQPMRHCR